MFSEIENVIVSALDGNKTDLSFIQRLNKSDIYPYAESFYNIILDEKWRWNLADVDALTSSDIQRGIFHAKIEQNGDTAEIIGRAILLDSYRRWWFSAIVIVNNISTGMIQRFGREGDDDQIDFVIPSKKTEWRKFSQFNNKNAKIIVGSKSMSVLLERLTVVNPDNYLFPFREIFVKKGVSEYDALCEEMNKPYEGWTVSQAVAANILGVTKVGAGIWV